MNELKIHGHSGCGLRVVEDNTGKLLVEKSCEESYRERLHSQYLKQLHGAQVSLAWPDMPFSTPYPSWVGTCMLMPYINAMSFIEYFEKAGKNDLDNLVNGLYEYVKLEMTNSKVEEVPVSKFIKKVQSVYENCLKNEIVDNDKAKEVCEYVIDYLKNLDMILLHTGMCHGDLTFSNILFRSSGKHSLIDYLDSFVETPLQDIVKIRQDTAYGWSLMMTDQSYNIAHVKTVMKYIDDRLTEKFQDNDEYVKYYDMLQYINILRILPYVKEVKVYDRLIEILNSIELK